MAGVERVLLALFIGCDSVDVETGGGKGASTGLVGGKHAPFVATFTTPEVCCTVRDSGARTLSLLDFPSSPVSSSSSGRNADSDKEEGRRL